MELFRQEHKKIWRRWSVRLSVFLCFLYVVVLGGFLTFQWLEFGTPNSEAGHGNHFDGYHNIRAQQKYAEQFAGALTDETVQAMTADFQRIDAENGYPAYYVTDYWQLDTWIGTLYPELTDNSDWRNILHYAPPEKLSGFYARRDTLLSDFLDMNSQTGAEREYLLSLDAKTDKPYHYNWVRGWYIILNSAGELGIVLALFLSITLSPVFSEEWRWGTRNVISSTKNGRGKIAAAKLCAALAFAAELFFMAAAGLVAAQLIYFGVSGWDQPVQLIKLIAVAPMNMLQAEIYEYTCVFLASLGFAGMVLLISALSRSNFIALIASLALVYVPMAVGQYLPLWGQKLLDLIPFVGTPTDIFRTNTYHLFGAYIWSPWLLISVPVVLGLLCLPFAVKSWARQLKK